MGWPNKGGDISKMNIQTSFRRLCGQLRKIFVIKIAFSCVKIPCKTGTNSSGTQGTKHKLQMCVSYPQSEGGVNIKVWKSIHSDLILPHISNSTEKVIGTVSKSNESIGAEENCLCSVCRLSELCKHNTSHTRLQQGRIKYNLV